MEQGLDGRDATGHPAQNSFLAFRKRVGQMNRTTRTTAALGLFSCLAMLAWLCQTPTYRAADPAPLRPRSEQPADVAKIERLIRQLGSDRFKEREAASKALDALGKPALPLLRKVQNNSDPEVRRRVADLLRSLKRKHAAARAKAWDAVKKLRGHIDSDTGTPDGQIGGIMICDEKLHDEDLSMLPLLDDAGSLQLGGPQITDTALVYLKTFYRLEILGFESTNLTGVGLVHLKDLNRLVCLVLNGTGVTDAGLVHLKALKTLWHLDLGYTRITDAGLDQVKEVKSLTFLRLSHTQITDAGLAKLKGLNLYLLDLSSTQITDAGLAHLKGAKHLDDLNLSKTRITDAGLAHLKTIPTLTRLWLEDTKVTKKGMDDLKKSLPKLAFVGRIPKS
jgi:uncharacterized protein YjbI with pentapeptide repeats